MIGNDIVDLKAAFIESDWQRDRFLNKLFTDNEQKIIYSAGNPSHMVWQLWSMKESAYKIFLNEAKNRFFAPLKFVCILNGPCKGFVSILNKTYITESICNQRFIHTSARTNEDHKLTNSYFTISKKTYQNQNKETYFRLLKNLSQMLRTPKHLLEITKDIYGAPKVYYKNRMLSLEVSISHHGHYGAFSILNDFNVQSIGV